MQKYQAIYFFLLLAVPLACASEEVEGERNQKLISTFQIVRFPNDACIGNGGKNGTCYTSAECSDKDGTSSGSCADGFGVCCTFIYTTCDQTSSENLTYWNQPSTVASGSCGLTVCPSSDDVCQLRLDFTTFVVTGPSTLTIVTSRRMMGQPSGDVDDAYVIMGSNYATNCLLDHFTVQSASPSTTPPIVCGTLTGEHMYVEADQDRCNKFNFVLAGSEDAIAVTSIGTRGLASLATRTWDITVTQLECTHVLLPNPGCTQYFYGSLTVTVASYNYFATEGTSVHLANQHQRVCIRREKGYCVGCFYGGDTDFQISGSIAIAINYTVPTGCCGYHTEVMGSYATNASLGIADANMTQFGFDCIIIPGAFGPTVTNAPAIQTTALFQQSLLSIQVPAPFPPQICGNEKGIGIGSGNLAVAGDFSDFDGANNITICTRHTPFTLEFLSDDMEGMGGTAGNTEFSSTTQEINNGFTLKHTQLACT